MKELDQIDFEIIRQLRNNARISNKDLADTIGLAPSSCLERTKYLRARGYLKGYHAEVDLAGLGIGLQAMVAVRLNRHSRNDVENFRNHLIELPQVFTVYHLSGANDFMVHIGVGDANQLRDFVLNAFTERSEVAHIETAVIYEEKNNWQLPDLL
jgi:DNA-binding Lrp family transcriptional regulator